VGRKNITGGQSGQKKKEGPKEPAQKSGAQGGREADPPTTKETVEAARWGAQTRVAKGQRNELLCRKEKAAQLEVSQGLVRRLGRVSTLEKLLGSEVAFTLSRANKAKTKNKKKTPPLPPERPKGKSQILFPDQPAISKGREGDARSGLERVSTLLGGAKNKKHMVVKRQRRVRLPP